MTDTHEFIVSMFADLDGYDRYETDLEQWASHCVDNNRRRAIAWRELNPPTKEQRANANAYTKAWRKANPDKTRALARRATAAYRKRNPRKLRPRIAKHPAQLRAKWKRNSAAYRARLDQRVGDC